VESAYYPQYSSGAVKMMQIWSERYAKNPDDKKAEATHQVWSLKVKGNRYLGEHLTRLTDSLNIPQDFDKRSCFRVTYGKYLQYYVANYDPKKYQKQIKDYNGNPHFISSRGRVILDY
jgi:hypothetical protein